MFRRRVAFGAIQFLTVLVLFWKLEEGVALRLHGKWRAARSWAFVDSFCFLPSNIPKVADQGVLEYSVVMPRKSRISLLFYYEGQKELDNAYYGDDLTCHEKYGIASLSGNAFPLFSYAEDSPNITITNDPPGGLGAAVIKPLTQQERDINAFSASIQSPVKKVSVRLLKFERQV